MNRLATHCGLALVALHASVSLAENAAEPGSPRQAAKVLLATLYLLTFVALLLIFIGLVWGILRRGRNLRTGAQSDRPTKYFDLRGQATNEDVQSFPDESDGDAPVSH